MSLLKQVVKFKYNPLNELRQDKFETIYKLSKIVLKFKVSKHNIQNTLILRGLNTKHVILTKKYKEKYKLKWNCV